MTLSLYGTGKESEHVYVVEGVKRAGSLFSLINPMDIDTSYLG